MNEEQKADSQYPEHDKLSEVHEQSQLIGEFIDWLGSNGYRICSWQTQTAMRKPYRQEIYEASLEGKELPEYIEYELDPQLTPVHRSVESWLAEYFHIDLKKLNQEKEEMLEHLRQAHNQVMAQKIKEVQEQSK